MVFSQVPGVTIEGSKFTVNLKINLTKKHFDRNGQLYLRCSVTVANIFQRSIERVAKLDLLPAAEQWPTQQLRGPERSASYASGNPQSHVKYLPIYNKIYVVLFEHKNRNKQN